MQDDFLIIKICKYFNYKYDEVMKMKANVYMRHLQVLNSLQAEENLTLLGIIENQLKLKYKSQRDEYSNLSREFTEEIKKEVRKKVIQEQFDLEAYNRL